MAAALILGVGWLLARIVQRIVTNLLAAVGVDGLADQVGLAKALGEQKLSGLIGLVLYVLILVPVLVASLNALALDAITRPASEMLNTFLAALPLVFAAGLVLVIAYFVGRVVSNLATGLLAGVGFNKVLVKLGVGSEPEEGARTPSEIVGNLVLVAIMLFATVEAVGLLGFDVSRRVGDAVHGLCSPRSSWSRSFSGLGCFWRILPPGRSRRAARRRRRCWRWRLGSRFSSWPVQCPCARWVWPTKSSRSPSVCVLGAIAVAAAIAFGIGGRDLAAETLKGWKHKLEARG